MQSTGHASTQAVSLVPIQGSAITYAIWFYLRGTRVLDADTSIRPQPRWGRIRVLRCGKRKEQGMVPSCAPGGPVRRVLLRSGDGRQATPGEHVGEESNQLLMNGAV